MKTCANCLHSRPDERQPKYLRCRKSDAPDTADASLAQQMRNGACGPDATLWEARDGSS